MIESDEFQRRSHPWIEQGGHQPIHLAHFSQALIGHLIRNDAHPQATTYRILGLTCAWGRNPGQHRAITEASLLLQVFPHPCFQRSQHMRPALPRVLQKPARGDASVHQRQGVPTQFVEEAVRAMHFRNVLAADL